MEMRSDWEEELRETSRSAPTDSPPHSPQLELRAMDENDDTVEVRPTQPSTSSKPPPAPQAQLNGEADVDYEESVARLSNGELLWKVSSSSLLTKAELRWVWYNRHSCRLYWSVGSDKVEEESSSLPLISVTGLHKGEEVPSAFPRSIKRIRSKGQWCCLQVTSAERTLRLMTDSVEERDALLRHLQCVVQHLRGGRVADESKGLGLKDRLVLGVLGLADRHDQQSAEATRMADYVKQGLCTHTQTGGGRVLLWTFRCQSCWENRSTACCGSCARSCHVGHDLIGPHFGTATCDCSSAPHRYGFTCRLQPGQKRAAEEQSTGSLTETPAAPQAPRIPEVSPEKGDKVKPSVVHPPPSAAAADAGSTAAHQPVDDHPPPIPPHPAPIAWSIPTSPSPPPYSASVSIRKEEKMARSTPVQAVPAVKASTAQATAALARVSGGAEYEESVARLVKGELLPSSLYAKLGLRLLWYNRQSCRLYWGDPTQRKEVESSSLTLISVTDLHRGEEVPSTFTPATKRIDPQHLQCCLEVVAAERRFKLKANSQAARDELLHALQVVVSHLREGRGADEPLAVGVIDAEATRMAKREQAGVCTFSQSGGEGPLPKWSYKCNTCWPEKSTACCGSCAQSCHVGHDLIGPFLKRYCDCSVTAHSDGSACALIEDSPAPPPYPGPRSMQQGEMIAAAQAEVQQKPSSASSAQAPPAARVSTSSATAAVTATALPAPSPLSLSPAQSSILAPELPAWTRALSVHLPMLDQMSECNATQLLVTQQYQLSLSQAHDHLLTDPSIKDYFVHFLLTFNGVHSACHSIYSRWIGLAYTNKKDTAITLLSTLLNGLPLTIPGASAVTSALTFVNDVVKKEAVNRMVEFCMQGEDWGLYARRLAVEVCEVKRGWLIGVGKGEGVGGVGEEGGGGGEGEGGGGGGGEEVAGG